MYIPDFGWGILVGILLTLVFSYCFMRYEEYKEKKRIQEEKRKRMEDTNV